MAGALSINPIDLTMMEFRFYESLTGIYEWNKNLFYTELQFSFSRDAIKRCNRNGIDKTVLETEFSHLDLLCFGIFFII